MIAKDTTLEGSAKGCHIHFYHYRNNIHTNVYHFVFVSFLLEYRDRERTKDFSCCCFSSLEIKFAFQIRVTRKKFCRSVRIAFFFLFFFFLFFLFFTCSFISSHPHSFTSGFLFSSAFRLFDCSARKRIDFSIYICIYFFSSRR